MTGLVSCLLIMTATIIVTCDIDQFSCVTSMEETASAHGTVISEYLYHYLKYKHLPKEIFNMTRIECINFLCFTINYYYGKTLPRNHYFCKWNNFVNLKTVMNLNGYLYDICEDGRVHLLNLS